MTVKRFVVETCHEGTDMCVRDATPQEIADEARDRQGWVMDFDTAIHLAAQSCADANDGVSDKRRHMRWFDFST